MLRLATAFWFFLLIPAKGDEVASPWACLPPEWAEEPRVEAGIFTAVVKGSCTVDGVGESSLAALTRFLRNELQTKPRFTVHAGPKPTVYLGLPGVEYDLTDHVAEDGDKLDVRQNVFVVSDASQRFLYVTESTEVAAEGHASYLRKVAFASDITRTGSKAEIVFRNRVEVERPWYALAFLFKPFSKKITLQKFEAAREKLLTFLVPPATGKSLSQDTRSDDKKPSAN